MGIKHRGHNEGSIRKRADGTFEVRYSVGDKRKSFYCKTEPEAKKKLKLILAEITKGDYLESCNVNLYDWLIEWLEVYKKNSIRESTYETHKSAIDCHIKDSDIGKIAISNLKPIHFQKLYNKKLATLSPATIKRLHVVLKDALKQAVFSDMIPKNPVDSISPPTMIKTEIKILTKEDQQKFIDALKDEPLGIIFIFAMETGIRIGELLALNWKDINMEQKTVTINRTVRRVNQRLLIQIPKTKTSRRSIPIMPDMIKDLVAHKATQKLNKMKNRKAWGDNDWLFPNEYGQIIEPRRLTEEFKRILTANEIPNYNFHALRHTFVSRLLEAGENPKTVAELIGHTKIAYMLDTYAHILPENKHSAIEKIIPIFQRKL